tara:strand:+ start:3302 stop:3958 length:657 start_codon:yes stop_codon:yes gene_type:complete
MDYIKYTPSTSNNWSRAQTEIAKQRPWAIDRVKDSMTASQLESKLYLGTELQKIGVGFNNVAVIGGWYCHILCSVLFDELNCSFVANYEIDEDAQLISYKFNRRYKDEGKYISTKKNLFLNNLLDKRQIEKGPVDLVINTSCEHMYHMSLLKEKQFKAIISTSPLFVLQSTDDNQYDDHINCVSGPEELADQAGLIHIEYMGTKKLSNGMNRFMVIGK